jgi:hypothetical protein
MLRKLLRWVGSRKGGNGLGMRSRFSYEYRAAYILDDPYQVSALELDVRGLVFDQQSVTFNEARAECIIRLAERRLRRLVWSVDLRMTSTEKVLVRSGGGNWPACAIAAVYVIPDRRLLVFEGEGEGEGVRVALEVKVSQGAICFLTWRG